MAVELARIRGLGSVVREVNGRFERSRLFGHQLISRLQATGDQRLCFLQRDLGLHTTGLVTLTAHPVGHDVATESRELQFDASTRTFGMHDWTRGSTDLMRRPV